MLVKIILGLLALFFVCLLFIRVLAKLYPFACPFKARGILENRFRRHFFGAAKTIEWVGVGKNMKVLELGSGTGFLTVEAVRRVGSSGRLYCVDIQPDMVVETREKVLNHNLGNVDLVVANALTLPFKDNSFDLAFLIMVLGEIPKSDVALKELNRVIVPGGVLSVSEFIFDPHYSLRSTVKTKAKHAGFAIVKESGKFFAYALNFRKIK